MPSRKEMEEAIGEIPDMPDLNMADPEFQQKFIDTLSPELQDMFYKGARGEVSEYELSKYMRTQMTEQEMQRIAESPMFASAVAGEKNAGEFVSLFLIMLMISAWSSFASTGHSGVPWPKREERKVAHSYFLVLMARSDINPKDIEKLSSMSKSMGQGEDEEEGGESDDAGVDQQKLYRLLAQFQQSGKNDRLEKTDFKVSNKE